MKFHPELLKLILNSDGLKICPGCNSELLERDNESRYKAFFCPKESCCLSVRIFNLKENKPCDEYSMLRLHVNSIKVWCCFATNIIHMNYSNFLIKEIDIKMPLSKLDFSKPKEIPKKIMMWATFS